MQVEVKLYPTQLLWSSRTVSVPLIKKLSESEKQPFQEEEKKLRAKYHIEAQKWKKKREEEKRGVEKETNHSDEGDGAGQEKCAALENESLPPPLEHGPEEPEDIHNIFIDPSDYIPHSAVAKAAAATAPARKKRRRVRTIHMMLSPWCSLYICSSMGTHPCPPFLSEGQRSKCS